MPVISVIMPVYNSKEYLSAAIESVLNQSFTDFELLLIDDGSSDGSEKICDEFAQKDKRIKLIHQGNRGMCAARNIGIQKSTGEYIAFMDNDDVCSPSLLKDSYETAKKENADIVKFGREAIVVNNSGVVFEKDVRELTYFRYSRGDIKAHFFELRNKGVFSPVWDGLYKTACIKNNGLSFNESLRFGEEDTIFCLQMLPHIKTLVTMPGVYYTHYIRLKHSASTKFDPQSLQKYILSVKEMIKTMKQLGIHYYKKSEFVICIIQNCIMEILLRLNYNNCPLSEKEKIAVLQYTRNELPYSASISGKDFYRLFRLDKKKAIFFILWKTKQYKLLLKIVKLYFRKKIKYM